MQGAEQLRVGVPVDDQILDDIWGQRLERANSRIITWLQHQGLAYATGLVSNSFNVAREREEKRCGFSGVVDTIVYSHKVGYLKPGVAIYLECASSSAFLSVVGQQVERKVRPLRGYFT